MNLFIDTNIFLSFYHFTSDDLEELKKLRVLLEEQALTLLIPRQVINEFRRNRQNKIADALNRLQGQRLNLQFPQVCKDYDEYVLLRELQKQYEKHHSALIKKITDQAWKESLKADKTVNELFHNATIVETDDEIVARARLRVDTGNPPGKNGSLGDAINWEVLLEHVPDGEDLFFVTEDKDYFSPLDKSKFNFFLLKEWVETKSSELVFYRQLSALFKDHYPDISLASELGKEVLIQQLAASSNFTQTHNVIAKLSKYSEFTATQANNIVETAISNSQIYWILGDEDVHDFITSVIKSNERKIDHDNLRELDEMLHGVPVQQALVAPDDDLPF